MWGGQQEKVRGRKRMDRRGGKELWETGVNGNERDSGVPLVNYKQ